MALDPIHGRVSKKNSYCTARVYGSGCQLHQQQGHAIGLDLLIESRKIELEQADRKERTSSKAKGPEKIRRGQHNNMREEAPPQGA